MRIRYVFCAYLAMTAVLFNVTSCGQKSNKAAKKESSNASPADPSTTVAPADPYAQPTVDPLLGGTPTINTSNGLMGLLPTLLGFISSPSGGGVVSSIVGGLGSLLSTGVGGIGSLLSGLVGIVGRLFA